MSKKPSKRNPDAIQAAALSAVGSVIDGVVYIPQGYSHPVQVVKPKPARVKRPKAMHGWSVDHNVSGDPCVYRNGEIYTDNELHMEWLAGWAKESAAWMEQQNGGKRGTK